MNDHEDEADELDDDDWDDLPEEEDTNSAREMAKRIGLYYRAHGECFCGGPLHITTDDQNIEPDHILFCMEEAEKIGDKEAIAICEQLLLMTEGERVFACMHKYDYAR